MHVRLHGIFTYGFYRLTRCDIGNLWGEGAIMAQPWQKTTCNHCASSDARLLAFVDGYHLVRCGQCSLAYIADPPTPDALAALYQGQGDYHSALLDPQSGTFAHIGKIAQRHLAFTRAWCPAGELIDIGCSTGMFLDAARRAGFSVSGTELSQASARFARDHFGLSVVEGDIHTVSAQQQRYDVVTMFDVIEHVTDPARDMAAAWQMLKPGGMFILSTPNIDGLFPRLSLPFARALGHWPHAEPPWHLYQFSVATLSAMLDKAGFECLGTRHVAIDLDYSFGGLKDLMRSPKRLGYALVFAPLVVIGPHIGQGDWFYLAARKP